MDLNSFWFILIAVLFAGFFFLEGFDFGVGMLLPFLGKDDGDRRVIINAIGPFWDGNEVWLLTAGGAMFAAFPHWYATLFSGLYLALVLMLLALIVRGVAFEFRSKVANSAWRGLWDWAIFAGSLVPALLWGVAIGNLIEGVPLDGQMNYVGGFFNLLNPFALITGVAFVALFLLHGSIFLCLRSEQEVLRRARAAASMLWAPAVALVVLFIVGAFLTTDIYTRHGLNPAPLTALAAVTLLAAGPFVRTEREGRAFLMTGLTIVLTTATVFVGLFPRVMVSSPNPEWSLTVYNASSSPYTLQVMSTIAIVFVPLVIAYQAWTYWVFRQRVSKSRPMEY